MSSPLASTVGAIRVGDIQCFPIADGDYLYPRSALCGDDPERTIGVPEQIAVPYTPLLVDTGSHRILIDTGAGPMGASCGHLDASLSRAGFHASDIVGRCAGHGLVRKSADGPAAGPGSRRGAGG